VIDFKFTKNVILVPDMVGKLLPYLQAQLFNSYASLFKIVQCLIN